MNARRATTRRVRGASNQRLCRSCCDPIHAHAGVALPPQFPAAWLAGFCSPACEYAHALQQLARRRAWWQR